MSSTEILNLISKYSNLDSKSIFLNSRLEFDLGFTGNDIYELLKEIQRLYYVDFSSMEFDNFINRDDEGILGYILNREQLRIRKAFPITIQHIIDIINKGEWFSPSQVKKF